MKIDINKLRKKRKWTGQEVGLALMANTLNDIRYHNQEHAPLFSQEEFAKMEKTLKTEKDEQVYSVYRSLYSSILDAYNTGLSLYQQFYNGHSNLMNTLSELKHIEHTRTELALMPVLLTKKQYADFRVKALEVGGDGAVAEDEITKRIFSIAMNYVHESLHDDEVMYNGIAVVELENTTLVDGNGYYKAVDPLRHFMSLKSLASDTKAQESIQLWQHNLIYNAMAYFYAYNVMIGILERVYNIENLASIARLETFDIENEVKKFNMSLLSLHDNVSGTDEIKKRKHNYIQSIFTKLEIEPLKPTQENVEKVRQTVEKLGFTTPAAANLKYLDDFLSFLSKELV
ncbi:MAG: hypothetical protein R3Y11_12280 [Pseudomonadota bacterium]